MQWREQQESENSRKVLGRRRGSTKGFSVQSHALKIVRLTPGARMKTMNKHGSVQDSKLSSTVCCHTRPAPRRARTPTAIAMSGTIAVSTIRSRKLPMHALGSMVPDQSMSVQLKARFTSWK